MVPVETPLGTPKARSRSVKARRSVTHAIKKRISVKYRQYNLDRSKPFSVNKTHSKLIHHFTLEYMVKGTAGLPVYEEEEDNTDSDEEYEKRVLSNYRKKAVGYEDVMGKKITAQSRSTYRARKESNAASGTGQGYHKNNKSPKKRVSVHTARARSINVTSPAVNQPNMQPSVVVERVRSHPDGPPAKKRLFSSPPPSPTVDSPVNVDAHNNASPMPVGPHNVVLAFEDL